MVSNDGGGANAGRRIKEMVGLGLGLGLLSSKFSGGGVWDWERRRWLGLGISMKHVVGEANAMQKVGRRRRRRAIPMKEEGRVLRAFELSTRGCGCGCGCGCGVGPREVLREAGVEGMSSF